MPFGRLHEEAAGDSKLLAVSDSAWRMWGMGLIYCQKNLTDGFIPATAIFMWGIRAKRLGAVADELCTPQVPGKEALWSKVDGGYQVHDYLQWNDSKEEILKGRADAKERIRRYRDREREERDRLEQLALRGIEQNPLRNALQNAHDVVRGRGDLEEKGVAATTASGADTVFAGSLPREHFTHAFCDPTFTRCVPTAVHSKLANLLAPKHGGDRRAAGEALKAWYPTVVDTLPAEFVMPDAFKFWQGRFDATFASTDAPASHRRSVVPDVNESRERQRRLREQAS